MGHSIDLVMMLGVPRQITCPHCNEWIPTGFACYDIDSGGHNVRPGEWNLSVHCNLCDRESVLDYKVSL